LVEDNQPTLSLMSLINISQQFFTHPLLPCLLYISCIIPLYCTATGSPFYPLALVQVASRKPGKVKSHGKEFVLDVGQTAFPARLKTWISDPLVITVLHGARSDRVALAKIGVDITNLFDTQVAHELLTGQQQSGLATGA
jgi:hypothetical protein